MLRTQLQEAAGKKTEEKEDKHHQKITKNSTN